METKEKKCRFGHVCTSGCQKDFDCPCQSEHYCAMSEEKCPHENASYDEICKDCGEKKVCEICGGSGEVSCDEDDGEGHMQRGVGTEKCECKISEPDDFSGASEGDR